MRRTGEIWAEVQSTVGGVSSHVTATQGGGRLSHSRSRRFILKQTARNYRNNGGRVLIKAQYNPNE